MTIVEYLAKWEKEEPIDNYAKQVVDIFFIRTTSLYLDVHLLL
jgi:hypothetical protein